jgi:response regulator of citrate/malate metabolism
MLQFDGYDVGIATTLEQARVMLEERTCALLLSRNAMPDGEGPELIAAVPPLRRTGRRVSGV